MSRITVPKGKEFVVFLIGMHIKKWWRLDIIIKTGLAMSKMIAELKAKPESGLLHVESWGGKTTIAVQYWESFEKLEAYASDRTGEHYPAWVNYFKTAKKSGNAVGVWHETYQVKADNYEAVYVNMPPFGLGNVFTTSNAEDSARKRMNL